ncbi:myb-like HTH transcriptional regulator family protein [Raphanus sativus]|uniref:Transcription factor MYB35 n=1 Tax=Raphanus sativus TaxID=3726 RepID=A0A6J0KQ02_RAPSA|nr:transcription factor MYB35 [Raphanus sativus]KAJ4879493.1 myb-like HTH transcriptional regulator family protein [Raphanus sativus]
MVKSCSSKSKNPWTDEDNAPQKFTFASASKNGSTPKKIGLRRCGKSCRVRKTENAGAKHESFTPEEEDLIIKMHAAMGSRWPLIAQHLPGKTEEEVKMVWNTKLKKKLSQMGIDHVTHRPFSHVLAEYGNINGGGTLNPNPMNQTGSLGPNPSLNEDSHNQQQQPDDSGDLMFHLQAIKLMTESSNQVKPESTFMYASSSSSNSSPPLFSSTCSTIAQESSEVNFTWSDFLLDQETFSENQQQNYPDQELDNLFGNEFSEAEAVATMANTATAASQMEEESLSNGFVESIIAKEKELFLGFPSYLEQPFRF